MNNRILKAFAPLVLASLILQPTAAFALQGGPFDNGHNPGASAAGTYSGVLTGKNLIGMTQFGISNTTQATGRFVVFHEGIMSYGLAEAIADPGNGRLAGALIGLALLPGANDDEQGENPSVDDANAVIDVEGRGAAEGAWTAEMKGFPVAITFEGKGEIATLANPVTVTTGVTVPNGVTITGGGTAAGSGGNDVQSVTGTTDATIYSTTLRATTPFEIRGSRTSLTNYTAITNFDGTSTNVPSNP